MKHLSLLAATVLIVWSTAIKAQNYSNWITDQVHPELKVRYYSGKDSKGYNVVYLQIVSSKNCKLEITSSLCSKDGNTKNSWYAVQLVKDIPATRGFKILNSCTDGFWWWYRNYKSNSVKFDDH